MNKKNSDPRQGPSSEQADTLLDEAIHALKSDQASPEAEGAALERVELALKQSPQTAPTAHGVSAKDDLKKWIPDYLADRLRPAQRLLFEDELHQSVALRRALGDARGVRRFEPPVTTPWLGSQWVRWGALAALLVLTVSLASLGVFDGLLPRMSVGQASVRSVEGGLFKVSAFGSTSMAPGEMIEWRDDMKTARNAGAVIELGDGSMMELRERSEFSIEEAADGITVNLERGSVIIQAAKRRRGHLYVQTNDCTVAVQGTLFTVNSGTKGSRVSVLEGKVLVEQGRENRVLGPGMQFTSNNRLTPVPLEEEIAWSQEASKYRVVLEELKALDRDLNQALFPGLRFSSGLLDLVPERTAIAVSLPNLGKGLANAGELFLNRMARKPALKQMWQTLLERGQGEFADPMLPFRIVEELHDFGDQIGDEVMIALELDDDGEPQAPLILTTVHDPQGLRDLLERKAREIEDTSGGKNSDVLRVLDDPSSFVPSEREQVLYLFIHDEVAAASPELAVLQRFQMDQAARGSQFTGTPFHQELQASYDHGVDWLIGVDLKNLVGEKASGEHAQLLGLQGLRYFLAELRSHDGQVESSAQLTFDGPRQGLMNILAAPASIGALELVSSNSQFAAAFAIREPGQFLDDLLNLLNDQHRGEVLKTLDDIHEELGVDLRDDLAGTLGGEFVISLDGPLFPPAFKLVVEVYDFERLQSAIEALIENVNQQLATEGKTGLRLSSDEQGDRTYYRIWWPGMPLAQINYANVDGYLIATPARSMIEDAIKYRASRLTLTRSENFQALLPQDGHTGFSALVYTKLDQASRQLVTSMARSVLTQEQGEFLREKAESSKGTLMVAYADRDRITLASRGDFSMSPSSFLSGLGFGALAAEDDPNDRR